MSAARSSSAASCGVRAGDRRGAWARRPVRLVLAGCLPSHMAVQCGPQAGTHARTHQLPVVRSLPVVRAILQWRPARPCLRTVLLHSARTRIRPGGGRHRGVVGGSGGILVHAERVQVLQRVALHAWQPPCAPCHKESALQGSWRRLSSRVSYFIVVGCSLNPTRRLQELQVHNLACTGMMQQASAPACARCAPPQWRGGSAAWRRVRRPAYG